MAEKLPELKKAYDSDTAEVLLAALDKVEAEFLKPGRYKKAQTLEEVAVAALYADAFLAYGLSLRRWLKQPEAEQTKLQIQLDNLKEAVARTAARLPFWKPNRQKSEG